MSVAATAGQRVDEALARLTAEIRAVAGSALQAIVLYGGLAKGRFTPGFSDINVLVVLEDASFSTLRGLAPALTAAARRDRVASLVVTLLDLQVMARLFPVKLLDIRATHRVLFGHLELDEIEVDRSMLRLRAVQEITNLHWRLRQRLCERSGEPDVLWGGLVQSLPSLAVTLEADLRSRGKGAPTDRGELLQAAARELGLPGESMAPFAALHRHESRPEDEKVYDLFEKYLSLLTAIAGKLDGGTGA